MWVQLLQAGIKIALFLNKSENLKQEEIHHFYTKNIHLSY